MEKNPDPEDTLLSYLREKLRLCGTKLGCGEGGCGACTVMVSKYNRKKNIVNHYAVNACLTPVCSMHGLAVTTVEGIGSTKTKLHPVQERIAKAQGSQCGFCTPGIVMSMYSLLRNSSTPNMKDLEITFQGNLCRCTGYRPIIEGYRTFTGEYKLGGNEPCAMGDKCCKNGKIETDNQLFDSNEFTPFDPSQEPIFPPELKLYDALDAEALYFTGPRVNWFRPTTLAQILEIKKKFNDAKIIVGNTEVGVEMKFRHFRYPVLTNPTLIPELTRLEINATGVRVGSAVTLAEMENVLNEEISRLPEYETRLFLAIVQMLHYFAGKQIRNAASVGGNIMTGSPISDLTPIFTAAEIE